MICGRANVAGSDHSVWKGEASSTGGVHRRLGSGRCQMLSGRKGSSGLNDGPGEGALPGPRSDRGRAPGRSSRPAPRRAGTSSPRCGPSSRKVSRGEFRPRDERLAALSVIGMCNWVAWWFHPRLQPSRRTGRRPARPERRRHALLPRRRRTAGHRPAPCPADGPGEPRLPRALLGPQSGHDPGTTSPS